MAAGTSGVSVHLLGRCARSRLRVPRRCLTGMSTFTTGKAAVVMTAAQDHRQSPPPTNGYRGHDDLGRSQSGRPSSPRSRVGGLWVVAVVFALVLLLLLIFVLQN